MPPNKSESRATEITVIVVLMALLVLLPPVLNVWAESKNPWYLPYAVWLGVIGLSYCLQRVLRRHAV